MTNTVKKVISELAIKVLKGTDKSDIKILAKALGISERTLFRWIKDRNMSLTTAFALDIISNHTGLPVEFLLEPEN